MTNSPFSLPEISKNHDSVSDSIVNLIINHLIQKQLKPGDKLPTEQEFVNKLKVSRNSVREAIKMLSSLGVVEIKRGIGTFVSRKCSASMFNPLILGLVFEQGTSEELGELRFSFERGVMQIITEKVTDGDITNLEEANELIKKAAQEEADNQDLIKELDRDFHRIFIGITRNKLIAKIGDIVYVLYRQSVSRSYKTVRDPIDIYRNHTVIIEKLRKKNLESLLRLVENFIKEDLSK